MQIRTGIFDIVPPSLSERAIATSCILISHSSGGAGV